MAKKILEFSAVVLAVIMFVICLAYVYIKYVDEQKTQITGSFIGEQVDPNTGEKFAMLDINVYSNGNEKGKEVVEFKLNGYSESTYQTIYSRGVQFIDGKYYTYDSNNGKSFSSAEVEFSVGKNAKILPILIGEEKFGIALNGTYQVSKKKTDGGNLAGWIIAPGIMLLAKAFGANTNVTKTKIETYEYTLEDFTNYCRNLARSHSDGFGDTYIPAVDLAEYFTLYKWNGNSYENASMYDDTNQSMHYFSVNVHYDYRGITLAKQSMFGSVAYDSQYNETGFEEIDYWRTETLIKLTNEDFDVRYSDEHKGNLISLKHNVLKRINNYEGVITCDVELDLDSFENVVGLDYYSLFGVNVKTLNINSSSTRSFKLLDYCLLNTNLQNLVTSQDVTIINSANSGYIGGVL